MRREWCEKENERFKRQIKWTRRKIFKYWRLWEIWIWLTILAFNLWLPGQKAAGCGRRSGKRFVCGQACSVWIFKSLFNARWTMLRVAVCARQDKSMDFYYYLLGKIDRSKFLAFLSTFPRRWTANIGSYRIEAITSMIYRVLRQFYVFPYTCAMRCVRYFKDRDFFIDSTINIRIVKLIVIIQ